MKKMEDFKYSDFKLGEIYETDDFFKRNFFKKMKIGNTVKLVAVSNVFQFENGEQITTTLKHKDYEEEEEGNNE